MNNKYNKIGIMGGTFNPPHLGHLILARIAVERLCLDKVIFIPTGKILYKDNSEIASARDRLAMTDIAIEGNPKFDVSDIEISDSGTTYTYKTLGKLREIYANGHFYFIVGADSLDYMDKWREPEKIFERCSVVALSRTGYEDTKCEEKADELRKRYNADIIFLSMPTVDISSTEIRKRIRCGMDVESLLPEGVERYIKLNNLYTTEK